MRINSIHSDLILRSYKLGTHNQSVGVAVSEYIAALKDLTRHRNLGEFLHCVQQERFVHGSKDQRIQSNLIKRQNPTFDLAREIITSMEVAVKDAKEFHTSLGTYITGAYSPRTAVSSPCLKQGQYHVEASGMNSCNTHKFCRSKSLKEATGYQGNDAIKPRITNQYFLMKPSHVGEACAVLRCEKRVYMSLELMHME